MLCGCKPGKLRRKQLIGFYLKDHQYATLLCELPSDSFPLFSLFPVSVCDCYDQCGRCLWSRHGYANTRPPHNPGSGETPALLSSLGAQGRYPDKIIRKINIHIRMRWLVKLNQKHIFLACFISFSCDAIF